MKKTLTLLLASSLFFSTITGCEKEPFENETTTEQSTPQLKAIDENTTDHVSNKLSLDSLHYSKLPSYRYEGGVSGVRIVEDQNDQKYIYIESWNMYYKLPTELLPTNAYLLEDSVWLIEANDSTVSTLKIKRGSDEVESYTCDIDMHGTYIVNSLFTVFDEDHAALFLWDTEDELTEWSIASFFVTTDGGKTWHKKELADSVSANHQGEYPQIAKFISDKIGILGYRYSADENLDRRTYLTLDGGSTWNLIASLPYHFDISDIGTEAWDFEYANDEYLLTVRIHDDETGISTIQFSSFDLVNWELVK